ncbi:serine/threonine-protein kinase [Streptomyces sp. JB150]|uniref:serine/threonine-protein kinase n=1 Tax=Streptomyces sp. JB150 TaxID=2714844 RepID=UPI00140E88E6|nr:serine/threonine-protein kinase [Streptomyces sp. JB150]QIJ63654.1 serine/threonine protein kinase [Streptomyces sp. JB150]
MGEVFAGRYELVDPIGRGGTGAVWRAWDHRRRRYVAAKVLQQSDAHSLLRFVREQALRIDHPHVLAPASWAADDDKVLFTMDLVAGGSLVHLVGDYGPLPPAFVCTLLDQLLSGLSAVHAEGVVHRDIKPANVLLEATGTGRPRLRLSDFGIAMRFGEPRLTETNLVVGTPGYLAPEQMMGADPDFPADLFAVGLVALYLLEGAKPDAKALVQYFAEHGTPAAPKNVPEPLWQVVAALLQPDPQARFRTATGARKALAAASELLPEPGPDDELIEIFDQLGPLPDGFGPDGPLRPAPGVRTDVRSATARSGGDVDSRSGTGAGAGAGSGYDSGSAWPGTVSVTSGTDPGRQPEHPRQDPTHSPQQGFQQNPGPARGPYPSYGPQPTHPPHTPHTPPTSPVPAAPPQPSAMSDTGSFHLPPPQAHASHPPQAGASRPPHIPHEPHHVISPRSQAPLSFPAAPPLPPPHQQHPTGTSTASYTARDPQVPLPEQKTSGRRSHAAARRPRPPARTVIPLLLLALACYAVGFWALTQI